MAERPPVTKTTHPLPFNRLSPADFERLCLWLIRREGYERAEHFGAKGSDQGRDVVASRDGRRVGFQCKRVTRFEPADGEKELAKLLELPAEVQPKDVVFIVTASVTAETRDRASSAWGDQGSCRFWADTELDERVQRHPEIMREFFDLGASGSQSRPEPLPQVGKRAALKLNPKVFLSYNSRDRKIAEKIAGNLRDVGAEVFFDRWQLAGVPWVNALQQRLRTCDAVVILIGPHGMGSWQQREVQLALDRVTREEVPTVPVLLPDCEPPLGFLRLLTWVDLREGIDDGTGLALLAASVGLSTQDESNLQTLHKRTQTAICPYRGLLPFREEDAPFYFGCEEDIDRLREALEVAKIVTVFGASGTGKSSLVRAGLVPRLRREHTWEVTTIRPRQDPLETLAAVCWPLLEDVEAADEIQRSDWIERFVARIRDRPERFTAHVRRILEKQTGTDRLLLVVDQAEELFSTVPESAREDFLRAITVAAGKTSLSVVLTLRAIFMEEALEDPWLGKEILRGSVPLGPMGQQALEVAIRRPAKAVSIRIDPHLAEKIVEDLNRQPGSLPLLEFTLTELWERSGGTALRVIDYDAFGGVQKVIAKRAESVYHELSEVERSELPGLFVDGLVRLGEGFNTRRRAFLHELSESSLPVMQKLVDARLLVSGRSERGGHKTLEVAHEALLEHWDRLRGWIDEDREFLLWRQRLRAAIERWERRGRDKGRLWAAGDLAEAERWLAQRQNLDEEEFLKESFAARRRRRRIRKAGIALVLGFSLLALLFAWYAIEKQRQTRARAIVTEAASHPDPAVSGRILASLGSLHPVGRSLRALGVAHRSAVRPRTRLRLLHDAPVTSATFSPDGQRIVSATEAGMVRVWSVKGTSEPVVQQKHIGWVSPSFSTDGSRIVSASANGLVRVWSVESINEPVVLRGNAGWPRSAGFSPDGGRVVAASDDGLVWVWSVEGNGEPLVLQGHTGTVWSASFSPNGRRVVSASGDGTVRVWNVEGNGEPLVLEGEPLVLQGHTGTVWSASFSPDGRRVVSASDDGTVRVWDVEDGSEPLVLRGTGWVRSARFSPDGRRVVSASTDGTVRIWNVDGAGDPVVLRGHSRSASGASFSPDGRRVVSGADDGMVRVWSLADVGEPTVLQGHAQSVRSASFSLDGHWVVSASDDGTVRVWDVRGVSEPVVLRGHADSILNVDSSPDGARIVSASHDNTVRLWGVEDVGEPVVLQGHTDSVWSVSFSPEGRRVASASADGTVRVWKVEGVSEPVVLQGHADSVLSVSFSPEGRRVASASDDGTVRVWSVEGVSQPLVLRGHSDSVLRVSFSNDGQRVLSVSDDGTARVWNVVNDDEPLVLQVETSSIRSASFDPDGVRVVSACGDKTVRVWNVEDVGEPLMFRGHMDWVSSASFSPDGRRVVSASDDGTVRVWDVEDIGEPLILRGHTDSVSSASFSPDGRRVVSASDDGTVRVWDVEAGNAPFVLEGHRGRASSAIFSRDGRRIISAANDDTLRVWVMSWDLLVEEFDASACFCLTEAERQQYLFESFLEAQAGMARCKNSSAERCKVSAEVVESSRLANHAPGLSGKSTRTGAGSAGAETVASVVPPSETTSHIQPAVPARTYLGSLPSVRRKSLGHLADDGGLADPGPAGQQKHISHGSGRAYLRRSGSEAGHGHLGPRESGDRSVSGCFTPLRCFTKFHAKLTLW